MSMKSHELDRAYTPITPVTPQFSISMISHCQPCKDDDEGEHESDPYLMTSMVAHCLYGTDTHQESQPSIDLNNVLNKTTAINEENNFFTSFVGHQLSFIECPLESPDYMISMVAHEVMENIENEDDNIIETESVSMLAHQICNESLCKPEDNETQQVLDWVPNNIVNLNHDSKKRVLYSGSAYKPKNDKMLNEQAVCDGHISRTVQTDLENIEELTVENETRNVTAASLKEDEESRIYHLNMSKQQLLKPKSGSYQIFLDAARIIKENTLERWDQLSIKRIQEIQENVEYEIDEYKRRKNVAAKDKDGKVKEHILLTNVKGIEFELHILIHHLDGHNEGSEKSVSKILKASEHRYKDNKQIRNESQNNKKKTIKYDSNMELNEHRNELHKTQVLHEIDVSRDSLEDYKEHILKVKTCTFAPGNDINLAIEQLLQLASTMENTLKYIAGMIYEDYEQANSSYAPELEEEKGQRYTLTSNTSDTNQLEDNILEEDNSNDRHVNHIDEETITDKEEQEPLVKDATNNSLRPLTTNDNTCNKSQPEGWCSTIGSSHSLYNEEDNNYTEEDITDAHNLIESEEELVTVIVDGDVADLEPIKTDLGAFIHPPAQHHSKTYEIFMTSFVCHQVVPIGLPDEFEKMPGSLASHMITTKEDGENGSEIDPGMMTSMVAHQMVVKDDTKTVSDEDLWKVKENAYDCNPLKRLKRKTDFARQLERHHSRMQENVLSAFSISMVSHQVPFLETELSKSKVSAKAHRVLSCTEGNSESLASMVSYQIRNDQTQIKPSKQETKKLQLNNKASQLDFQTSLASHQLPEVSEYPEFLTSMAAHQDITTGRSIENTNAELSMHTHALVQDNTISDTGHANSEQDIHESNIEKVEQRTEVNLERLDTEEDKILKNKTKEDEIMEKEHLPDSIDESRKEIDDDKLIKVVKTSKTKEKSVTKLKIQARGTIESKSGNKNEQTYKVRFRVKLSGQDGSSSKLSVLQYLRGCLTGQSLFQAKQ